MYVKWDVPKYHIFDESGAYNKRTLEPSKSQISGKDGHPPIKTICGREISVENVCRDRLPQRVDRDISVCHQCDRGVCALKFDQPAEQARKGREIEAVASKVTRRGAAAAQEMFGQVGAASNVQG